MAFLISGKNAAGTGILGFPSEGADLTFIMVESSGNSASASLLMSPNGIDRWVGVTSWAVGVNATATAYLTAFYPFLGAQVVWASGGTNTGTVYLQAIPRRPAVG